LSGSPDVVIVGAGMAGAVSARLLALQGVRVTLVDPLLRCAPCFKAEKIEPDQRELLEKFGLMERLVPLSGKIGEVFEAKDGRVLRRLVLRQNGIRYHEMVNALRDQLPAGVDFRVGRVREVASSPEGQRVRLDDGSELETRLVVLASGTAAQLASHVGPPRRTVQNEQSVNFGFDVARADGRPFAFESVTYHPEGTASGVGYLTLFPIGRVMRANLFTFWPLRGELATAFVREPRATLERAFPRLARLVGAIEVTSRVESARVDLFRVERAPQAGVVPIADAFQSVCPSTGTGLSKVLTDADVLCHELVPEWLASPGLAAEKAARFFDHPRKRGVDERSLSGAAYRRRTALDGSLRWRIHRARLYSSMRLRGGTDASRLTKALRAACGKTAVEDSE
jgi:2-polyprenyl-6-methoxyphenol hydroxylase-like FAD-dependent oxidoreductase